MSKIIKRQVRKSIPFLVILFLLNFTLYGIFFNLELDHGVGPKALWSNWLKEVRADNATSTVKVKNAAPAFTANPAESPVSSSTSPVNVSGSISFTATANDPEDNNYYLLVCSSAAATAGAGGGAPSCNATTFCVSAVTNDTQQATCTYNNVTDPGAETRNWWAFVCDNHGTEAECSASNQGSGDSGSPIYINHAPSFTAVYTSDDNKNPGGVFTITATSSDTDVQGGDDVLWLDVCSTNSWSTTTGCAVTTLCTGTSTDNPSCQYTDTAPTPHGAQVYYAYIKDWHEMPAATNPRSSSFNVNDVSPTVGAITLNNGAPINLNIKGAPAKTVWATSTSVTDDNGCTDLVDATSTFFMSNVANGRTCTADDNNCYWVNAANCNLSECTGADDSTATFACLASLAFYSVPTTASGTNPYASYYWEASINAYDGSFTGWATSSGVELNVSTALDVATSTIPYGILQAGQNSGTNNATTTVVNFGNSPLSSDLTGTWMTKAPDVIPESQQKFDIINFDWSGGGTFTLSSTTPATVNLDAQRPTSVTDVTDDLYWGIGIPVGTPSGDYSGLNTFTAILDTIDGVWN